MRRLFPLYLSWLPTYLQTARHVSIVNSGLFNSMPYFAGAPDSGRAFAFLILGGNLFGLLAPIVTGYIVQATGSFASAFLVAGGLAPLGAMLPLTLTRHTLGESPTIGTASPISYSRTGSPAG